jgi:uncharacterized alpha-E superfamily protein
MSQMPVWADDQISPKSAMLRVFAISDGADSWQVLPGGLMRIAHGTEEMASMQRGGSSADVWVVGGDKALVPTVRTSSETPRTATSSIKRVVTSRAAENLFWLGRYSERTECSLHTAQLILSHLHADAGGIASALGEPDRAGHTDTQLPSLFHWFNALAVQNNLVLSSVPNLAQSPRVFERSLIAALSQTDLACSVGFNLRALKNAAFSVRERLSQEQWNLIVESEQQFFTTSQHLLEQGLYQARDTLGLLNTTSITLAAITGAQTDRMTRDDGWRLLSIGRLIERLSFLSSSLLAGFQQGSLAFNIGESETAQGPVQDGDSLESHQDGFSAMISLFGSTVTFRAQHHGRDDLAALLESLVLDTDNPRSLAWVAQTLRGRLAKLAGDEPQDLCATSILIPDPKQWQLQDVLARNNSNEPEQLIRLLQACLSGAQQVAQAISAQYFTHTHMTEQSLGA